MNTKELEKICIEAYLSRAPGVTLTLPKKGPALGLPRGELLSVNAAGERNYRYDPLKLLAWIRANEVQS